MKFLLDTCLISELAREKPNAGVLAWLEQQDENNLYLSVLTLGELQKGAAKLPDGARKVQLQEWIENDLRLRFTDRVLGINVVTALQWGDIQGRAESRGRKMPVIDSLLAATALVHRLTVVTRNGADIVDGGAPVLNPWQDG